MISLSELTMGEVKEYFWTAKPKLGEVFEVLSNAQTFPSTTSIDKQRCRSKAGEAYVYHYTKESNKVDWKSDAYRYDWY